MKPYRQVVWVSCPETVKTDAQADAHVSSLLKQLDPVPEGIVGLGAPIMGRNEWLERVIRVAFYVDPNNTKTAMPWIRNFKAKFSHKKGSPCVSAS